MCGGPEQLNSSTQATSFERESESLAKAMNNPIETVESAHSFSALLELAADNDVEGFKQSLINDPHMIDETGLWYAHKRASKRTVLLERTPLMVASMYGSVDVVKLILSLSKVDINRSCGSDKSTALHCAASGGSVEAVDVVKLLLLVGADPSATDCYRCRPFDVISSPPCFPNLRVTLKELLKTGWSICQIDDLRVSTVSSMPSSPSRPSSSETGLLSSLPEPSLLPPTRKEYAIDPSIPDIRNSFYATDEFRMFAFKIQPCSRSFTHDWTKCPFVHPGENARRRDPKKFHYSCVPCPDHRKAPCRRGDLCEYAHGVFESLLHPAQYRTRICKDGTNCLRRVCFFAHTAEELRPLYLSTRSAVPSPPHSATSAVSAAETAAANAMSPPPSTPSMSPRNVISQVSMAWSVQNVLSLQIPVNHLQMSSLRSSLNAKGIQMSLNGLSCLFPNHSMRSQDLAPSNLIEHFSSEVLSPRYSDQLLASPVFSPSQKSAIYNQFQHQESVLSPVETNVISPKNGPSFQGIEPLSPLCSMASDFANLENQYQHLRSLGSRDLRSKISQDVAHDLSRDLGKSGFASSPENCWSQWESPIGKVDWSVQAEELGRLCKSFTTGHCMRDPEASRIQSLAKESPSFITARETIPISGVTLAVECSDPKQIDQIAA